MKSGGIFNFYRLSILGKMGISRFSMSISIFKQSDTLAVNENRLLNPKRMTYECDVLEIGSASEPVRLSVYGSTSPTGWTIGRTGTLYKHIHKYLFYIYTRIHNQLPYLN